jgi:hypothetical protein
MMAHREIVIERFVRDQDPNNIYEVVILQCEICHHQWQVPGQDYDNYNYRACRACERRRKFASV